MELPSVLVSAAPVSEENLAVTDLSLIMLVHFQALLSVAPNYDSYDPTLVSLFTLSWPATPDLTSVFEGHLLIEFLWLSPQFLRLGLLIELPILSTILGILYFHSYLFLYRWV